MSIFAVFDISLVVDGVLVGHFCLVGWKFKEQEVVPLPGPSCAAARMAWAEVMKKPPMPPPGITA